MSSTLAVCQLLGAYPDEITGTMSLSLASRLTGDDVDDQDARADMVRLAALDPDHYQRLSREFRERYGRQQALRIDHVLDRCWTASEPPAAVLLLTGVITAECLEVIDKYAQAFTVVVYLDALNREFLDLEAVRHSGSTTDLEIGAPTVVIRGPKNTFQQNLQRGQSIAATASETQRMLIKLTDTGAYDSLSICLEEFDSKKQRTVAVQLAAGGISADVNVSGRVKQRSRLSPDANLSCVELITLVSGDERALNLRKVLVVPGEAEDILADAARELTAGGFSERTIRRLEPVLTDTTLPSMTRELARLLQKAAHTVLAMQRESANNQATGTPAPLDAMVIPVPIEYPAEVLYSVLSKDATRSDTETQLRELLDKRKQSLAGRVRSWFLRADDVNIAHAGYTWVFYATLGSYDEERARSTLSRQQTMLQTLGQLTDLPIELVYRFTMSLDPGTNAARNRFAVICRTKHTGDATKDAKARKEAEAFARLVHTVMHAGYQVTWTDRPDMARALHPGEERKIYRFAADAWPSGNPWPDWGLIASMVDMLGTDTTLEMVARPTSRAVQDAGSDVQSSIELVDNIRLKAGGPQSLRVDFTLSATDLPDSLVQLIEDEFQVRRLGSDDEKALGSQAIRPYDALKRFHPPFGDLPSRGVIEPAPLYLFVEAASFPAIGLELGTATARLPRVDQDEPVRLGVRDRLRHMYIIGKTGAGKTNFLKNLAAQDVNVQGQGMAVIDPHGELVDHTLAAVPKHRLNDVILLDFSQLNYLPVLNPLSKGMTGIRREQSIQMVLRLLRERVYHEFTGPRFEQMVRMCLATIIHERFPDTPALHRVPRLLEDQEYRKAVVAHIKDPEITRQWRFHDSQRGDRDFASTLDWAVSKFADLAQDETLLLTLGGGEATVDLEEVVRQQKILLVKLPEAVIGPDAAQFLGALVVIELRLAAFRRGPDGIHDPFFVYLDEFQKFATTDIDKLVAEARKFGIGFVLAHQNLQQLHEFSVFTGSQSRSLFDAVMGNVANTFVFNVGVVDRPQLAQQLGINTESLARVGRFEAVARVTVDGKEVGPFVLRPPLANQTANPRNLKIVEERMQKDTGPWQSTGDLLQTAMARYHAEKPVTKALPKASARPAEGFLDRWLAEHRVQSADGGWGNSGDISKDTPRWLDPVKALHDAPKAAPTARPSFADTIQGWLDQRTHG